MNYRNLNKVVKQIECMGKEDHIQLLSILKIIILKLLKI